MPKNPPGSSENEMRSQEPSPREGVAIIGLACMFPGAPDAVTYWRNIVSKVDAVGDPPGDPWNPGEFYEPGTTANDRVYCKRGGYLGDLALFDPLDHGVMPNTVDGGEPDQWLALKVAHAAMADAGYLNRAEEGHRAEVILGKGTYINRGNLTVGYHGLIVEQLLGILRNLHPEYSDAEIAAIKQELKEGLPPFSADTAPALIGNIIAGRLANRLDLMGPSYTVDAACASALIATDIAVKDLLDHKCDLALVGGVHVHTPAPTFMLFCQLSALSRREQIRPFDKDADGTILGEGLGMVVLKRLGEAERDGDRIYAVIKGAGTSSDGRAVHVMAPRLEGEELALRRAYEMAGISPDDVSLIEAHGTATPVGDQIEVQALRRVFGERDGGLPRCALGSVKSMIGHTMPAAGIAGLIKTALAVYHRVLPPTLHCETPDPKLELERTPFYINTDTRPWINGSPDAPRRAGVNSFGFGGVNAHVVLEEYSGPAPQEQRDLLPWDNEVCILEAESRQALVDRAKRLLEFLANASKAPRIEDVAYTLSRRLDGLPYRLSIVTASPADLSEKLDHAVNRLSDPECRQVKDSRGIYFFDQPISEEGKLAFMFPGEGAQYPNMLLDLCLHFPEVRGCFDLADRAFIDHPRQFLPSDFIFPRPATSESEGDLDKRMWRMDGAVEAVLIGNWAMWTLLKCLQIRPDVIVGHSTGDYSAMFASGIIQLADDDDFVDTILSWNNVHEQLARELKVPEASLVAVASDAARAESIIDRVGGDIHVAMDNCPHQSVMVGAKPQVDRAVELLQSEGIIYEVLPFDRPYHTSIFEQFAQGWCDRFFAHLPLAAPSIPAYSCTSVAPFPDDIEAIKELFIEHWIRPVRFRDTVERMYADGVRVFVEVGPRGNLTAFVDDILRGQPHLAVNSNVPRRSGISQLNHMVGLLAAQRVEIHLDYLYARRDTRTVPLEEGTADDQGRQRRHAPTRLSLGVPSFEVTPRPPAPARAPAPASLPLEAPVTQQAPPAAPRPSPAPAAAATSRPIHDAPRAPAAAAAVMGQYNRSMGEFLDLQDQVMRAFLKRSRKRGEPRRDPGRSGGFPLLGTVRSIVPGQELTALRQLDPREDWFLREHALGGPVSDTDPTLRPISVVPLTMSMEMLAEAASALMPGKTLVGMRDILARRWIQVDDQPVSVAIEARRRNATEIEVKIRRDDSDSVSAAGGAAVVLQGTVVFAERYPAPPPAGDHSLTDERRSRLAASNLYDEGLMFHGPCFQGVASVERTGEDGLIGTLEVLPTEGLFRSASRPGFVTDPVVLDAAGQLVGYWAAEHLDRGFVVFPYRVAALHIYQDNQPAGTKVACRLRLQLLGNEGMRSDLEVLAPDGTLWMRLRGWEDRRFDLPKQFHRFWVSPGDNLLSRPWPLEPLPAADSVEACRAEACFTAGDTLWQDLWASLILSRQEREAFRRLGESGVSPTEWLTGATAAKDAVRMFLKAHHRLDVYPADIEIGRDEDGGLEPQGSWTRGVSEVPAVTLAHSNGVAVAIARPRTERGQLGVELLAKDQPSSGFAAAAFSRDEQELLASLPASAREEWSMRLWSAKAATAKALGRRVPDGALSVRIRSLDRQDGVVMCAIEGELASLFPEFAGADIPACTAFEDDHALAVTFLDEALR
jgi:acyl transferase domain-containing protein/phosphopantetheinyl transferase (holo-ACP synthase)